MSVYFDVISKSLFPNYVRRVNDSNFTVSILKWEKDNDQLFLWNQMIHCQVEKTQKIKKKCFLLLMTSQLQCDPWFTG